MASLSGFLMVQADCFKWAQQVWDWIEQRGCRGKWGAPWTPFIERESPLFTLRTAILLPYGTPLSAQSKQRVRAATKGLNYFLRSFFSALPQLLSYAYKHTIRKKWRLLSSNMTALRATNVTMFSFKGHFFINTISVFGPSFVFSYKLRQWKEQ